ncbi:putative uncharacterized protein MYH16 [Hetaerina americana]|uniref:putative uncharacterized protein MYH16 n=1 Tax=Hetaerina americana TaxID=62018 RepID=UPI003A7F6122
MDIKEVASVLKEPDMFNFEKRLREALHELSLKRVKSVITKVLLEESRKDLNQALLVKYDLERRLDKVCRELEESRVQLELAVSAGRKWEEEREAIPLHRAQLQATSAERDTLKEQARTLQFANVELKRRVEELEGQVHCLSSFQNGTITLQTKVEEVIREVKRQSQSLSQDQKRLERSVKAASNLGARLELTTRHNGCMQEKMKEQIRKMEAKVIALATELDCLKQSSSTEPVEQNAKEQEGIHFNEWKSSLHEMESRLQSSEECRKKLQRAMESALEISAKLEKESKKLKEENVHLSESNQKAESHLKELQESHLKRKINCKDEEVQVDCLFIRVSCSEDSNATSLKVEPLAKEVLEEKKLEE